MIRMNLILLVVLPLLLLSLDAVPSLMQGRAKAPTSASKVEKETVKGIIDNLYLTL